MIQKCSFLKFFKNNYSVVSVLHHKYWSQFHLKNVYYKFCFYEKRSDFSKNSYHIYCFSLKTETLKNFKYKTDNRNHRVSIDILQMYKKSAKGSLSNKCISEPKPIGIYFNLKYSKIYERKFLLL